MLKIYSKKNSDLLLHIINRLEDIDSRTNIVPDNNFIQCSTLKMENGKTFPPHKHIKKERYYKEQILPLKHPQDCIFQIKDDSLLELK